MKTTTKICLSIALISIGLGIGLLFIAAGRGFSLRNTPTFSMEDTVRDVEGLDIRIDVGEVFIRPGDEFSIQADNLYNDNDLKSHVSNGVWEISHDANERFNFFGIDIPISIGIRNFKTPSIRITIPEGFKAKDIKISMDAGRLKAENLHADIAHLTVDAGSLEIDGLIVEEESSYFVSAGHINLKQVDIKNIKVECDVGAVIMEGLVSGDNEIQCNVGSIELDIDDNMDYYSFDIDSDIGNVIINNKRYRNFINTKDRNDFKGNFRLNVDVGNITMDFSEY
ncbi:MAG: DUF4097 domain-containing protein [Clostridiales bacterium]|jgi:hypothetical protein|nr:DUF4097 domain-containing protein [Clostridiales bacterium]